MLAKITSKNLRQFSFSCGKIIFIYYNNSNQEKSNIVKNIKINKLISSIYMRF